jgi:hypothetical protein
MICPFIDDGRHKCEQKLHVDQLLHVMSVCGHDFERCPIYQEQVSAQHEAERKTQRILRKCA